MADVEFILVAVTLVLALAWLISRYLFLLPASRDLIWRTALVAVALTPALTAVREPLIRWQWRLAILPAAESALTAQEGGAVKLRPLLDARSPMQEPEAPFLIPLANRPHATASPGSARSGTTAISAEPLPVAQESWTAQRWATWATVAAEIWFLGCLIQLVRLVRAAWNTRRILADARSVMDQPSIELNRFCAEAVGLKWPAKLLASSRARTPIVSGFFRSRIVVPTSLLKAETGPQLRAALLHENGHIRRHDLAFDLVLKVVVALFWPHPLIHVMAMQIRRLREELCDNFVLAQESPVKYAQVLLQLAIGIRLKESPMLGLGMIARPNRLEDRVNSLLAPNRPRETRPARSVYWTVLGSTCMLLATGMLVRIDRTAAAPAPEAQTIDEPKPKTEKPKKAPAAAEPKSAVQQAASPQGSPRQFQFQIVTSKGKPVVGATVAVWAIGGIVGSAAVDEKQTASTKTDANGVARITFTKEMDRIATALSGKSGLEDIYSTLALRIDHPDHPVWSKYVSVGGSKTILLDESTTLTVRAHRAKEAAFVTRLYPELGQNRDIDWSEANGVLTIRRVNVSDIQGYPWLRIVHVPEKGPAWFSDMIDLRHLKGNPLALDVSLNAGVRVEGRLADNVPRPVRKGRVVAGVVDGRMKSENCAREIDGAVVSSPTNGELFFNAATEIAPDGTFVLESLPRDHDLQLFALCDGWVSRSPTKEELKAYLDKNDSQRLGGLAVSGGHVIPQLSRLTGAIIKPVIAMDRTTACEVTVLDADGRPIPNATVSFWPNEVFASGSSYLGAGADQISLIREQFLSGNHKTNPNYLEHVREYSAKTNALGVAVVDGLPAPADGADAPKQAMFAVTHDRYIAISNYPSPNAFPTPILVVTLARGKTECVTVHMNPMPPSGAPEKVPPAAPEKDVPLDQLPPIPFEQLPGLPVKQ